MKRWVVAMVLMPSISFGAVTQAQIQQAQQASAQLVQAAQNLLQYTNYVNALYQANFQMSVLLSTDTVAIPQAVKDQVVDVAKYQALKQKLVDAFNQLP